MSAPRTRISTTDWPRVLALLDQALDLPTTERDNWLHNLNQPEEVVDALGRLLKQRMELEAQDFLAAMPPVVCTDPVADALSDGWSAGALAGPWRLVRPLGRGGMSVVWLAERADGQMQRPVALKLPHAGVGQEGLAKRLLRERRILAALEHPHIARLYDVGLTDDGLPYLAMEFVEGQSLLAYADGQRLTTAARVALFQQVLSAVHFAHGQLVLHRDLKPANILVTKSGQVKLLDFGIAKLLTADPSKRPLDETDLTRGNGHLLTPSYASPEQWLGQPLGVASDIYALGVVLYELLAGCRPHISAGLQSTPQAAGLQHAVLNEEPLPPSQRRASIEVASLRSVTPPGLTRELHGDLDAVCLKALARLPAQRYLSADALAADLTRWQVGKPVLARPPGPLYLAAKLFRRNRRMAWLGSSLGLALLATGAAALWQGQAAWRETQRATMARDFVLGLLADSSIAHLKGAPVGLIELLELGRKRALAMTGDPQLQGELLAGIGQTQADLGELSAADAALDRAAQLFKVTGDTRQEASAHLARLELVPDALGLSLNATRAAQLGSLERAIQGHPSLRGCWLLNSGRAAPVESQAVGLNRLQLCAGEADLTKPDEWGMGSQSPSSLAHNAALHGGRADRQKPLQPAKQLPVQYRRPVASVQQELLLAGVKGVIRGSTPRGADMGTTVPNTLADFERTGVDPER